MRAVLPVSAAALAGMPLGRTPLTLAVVPPGHYTFELSKEQHRAVTVSGKVEPGGSLQFDVTSTYYRSPRRAGTSRTGLGRGDGLDRQSRRMGRSHEVTQEEYERLGGPNPSYFKAPNHPVDSVNWFEAVKFSRVAQCP